jgi:hypothetical protein
LAAVAVLVSATQASAAFPWVDRRETLPEHDWAFDFGLGVGHADYGRNYAPTGVGLNLEMAVSPIHRLELGFRTGIRAGNEARAVQADAYGRLFDRQTFGTYNDVVADPEVRVRGAVVETRVFELGLEGRVFLPVEAGSRAGTMFGLPLWFHFGGRVRLDTGVYVPVIFAPQVDTYISAPIDVWIQCTQALWLGPMGGFVFHNANNRVDVPLGFGLGYQFTRTLDLKTQVLFPAINQPQGASQAFGFGVGIQVRIE